LRCEDTKKRANRAKNSRKKRFKGRKSSNENENSIIKRIFIPVGFF